MNDLSQVNRDVIIEITKSEVGNFVSIKPYNQVNQVFCCDDIEELYRQILRFLMGYLAGYMERYPMDFTKLWDMIGNMKEFLGINIQLVND